MSDIDKLKATISKKGGLAKANRFNVMFTPPTLSLLNLGLQGIISSAISGNFSPKNLINDPRDISLLCDSVSIPGKQISTIEHQTVRELIKVPYGYLTDDVELTFLLTNDYHMKTMFDAWINSIVDKEKYCVSYKEDITCDVIIQQLDEQNTPIYGVKLEGAFPVTMSEISLSNENSNIISKLTVSFAYDRYVPEGAVSSTASLLKSKLSIFG